MNTVEPETASWTVDEVETLTNGVGRFEDDLHQVRVRACACVCVCVGVCVRV